jgi:hypothetical protein
MQITHDRIEYDNFVLQKLQNDYVVKTFDCGNPELNDYFNNDSQAHRLELMTPKLLSV